MKTALFTGSWIVALFAVLLSSVSLAAASFVMWVVLVVSYLGQRLRETSHDRVSK